MAALDAFHKLVADLVAEHESTVEALRAENASLRARNDAVTKAVSVPPAAGGAEHGGVPDARNRRRNPVWGAWKYRQPTEDPEDAVVPTDRRDNGTISGGSPQPGSSADAPGASNGDAGERGKGINARSSDMFNLDRSGNTTDSPVHSTHRSVSSFEDQEKSRILKRAERLRECWACNDAELLRFAPQNGDFGGGDEEIPRTVSETDAFKRSRQRHVVLKPDSNAYMAWSVLNMFVLAYDAIMGPMSLIDNSVSYNDHNQRLYHIVSCFWLLDMLVTFRTSYYYRGVLVTEPKRIAKRYLKTWFIWDVVLVVSDWISIIVGASMLNLRFGRVVRVVRLARALRLAKLARELTVIRNRIHSNSFDLFVTVVMYFVCTLLSAHFAACVWCALGSLQGGWVEATSFRSEEPLQLYAIAINFCLAQLLAGTTNVFARTMVERLFVAIFLSASLLIVAGLIGVVGSWIHWKDKSWSARNFQFEALASFSKRYQIAPATHEKVQRFIYMEAKIRKYRELDEALLKAVPTSMRETLLFEKRGHAAAGHGLFTLMSRKFSRFFHQLLDDAMQDVFVHAGNVVFEAGHACRSMRFVAEGAFRYVREEYGSRAVLTSDEPRRNVGVLKASSWISEPVLWIRWAHQGTLRGLDSGVLCVLDATKFQTTCFEYPIVRWVCTIYARQFLENLNDEEVFVSDVVSPPPMSSLNWDSMRRDDSDSSPIGQPLPWQAALPPHISRSVCRAIVTIASEVAAKGLDEGRMHHGFTIVVGDEHALESCGRAGFNPFQGHNLLVVDSNGNLCEEVFDTMRRNAFHADGAIVVDGSTGRVVASGWFVDDISLGGTSGGARSRSAKAIAQQAGTCYVIKCSEDSRGELLVHLGNQSMTFFGPLASDADALEAI